MQKVIIKNRKTRHCIIETRYGDERYCDGPYGEPVARFFAGEDARMDIVEPYSDAWREACASLED